VVASDYKPAGISVEGEIGIARNRWLLAAEWPIRAKGACRL
jgi:hypothetical protein